MSQAKIEKLATGGGITTPETPQKPITGRKLRFKANGQLLDMDESLFASEYEKFANGLGGKGKNREDWDNSYNTLIDNIAKGQETGNYYDFTVGDNRSTKIKYEGSDISNTDRGVKDNGKTKGIGLFSGITGEKNDTSRAAALNEWAGGVVSRGVANRNQTIKTEEDARIAKEKEEATKLEAETKANEDAKLGALLDNIRFDNYFGRSLDGSQISKEQQYRMFHQDPSKQEQYNRDYLNRIKETVNNPMFSTDAGKKAFSKMFPGADPETFTKTVQGINTAGRFNAPEIYKRLGMFGQYSALSDRTGWDQLQKSKQLEDLDYQNKVNGMTGTPDDTKKDGSSPDEGDGTDPYANDLQFGSNIDFTNYLDANVNIKGVPTRFGDYLSKTLPDYSGNKLSKENADYVTSRVLPILDALRGQYKNDKSYIDPLNNTDIWSEDQVRYNPYGNFGKSYDKNSQLLDVDLFKDITGNFSGLDNDLENGAGGRGTRDWALVEEILRPRTGEALGRRRYRMINSYGVANNVDLQQKADGTTEMVIYKDPAKKIVKSRKNLGKVRDQANVKRANPFAWVNGVQKPVLKSTYSDDITRNTRATIFQYGGSIEGYNDGKGIQSRSGSANLMGLRGMHETKQRKIDVEDQLVGNIDTTESEKLELAALAGDIVGLGASFVPGGGLVSGISGMGSSLAHARANALKGESWGLELGANLALDAASVIPIAGSFAKASKIAKAMPRMLKSAIGMAMLTAGGSGVVDAARKIADGDYSAENMRVLVGGLTTALAGKRFAFDQGLAFNKTRSGDVNLKVDGVDTKFKLTEPQLDALEGKNVAQQKDYITGLFKKVNPTAGEIELPAIMKRKYLGVAGPKKETGLELEITKGNELKDYDTAGWFGKRAIKRQIKMNPGLNPVLENGEGRFNTSAITYKGMNRKPTPELIPESRRIEPSHIMAKRQALADNVANEERNTFRETFANEHAKQNMATGEAAAKETASDVRAETLQQAKDLRDSNLAKGRQPGPKLKSRALKENIANEKIRKGADPVQYEAGAADVNPIQGPSRMQGPAQMEGPKEGIGPKFVTRAEKATKGTETVTNISKAAKTDHKPKLTPNDLKSLRKALGFKANVETDVDLNVLINPVTKPQRKLSNKVAKLAQHHPRLAKYLDQSLDIFQAGGNQYKTIKFEKGGVLKAQFGMKFGMEFPELDFEKQAQKWRSLATPNYVMAPTTAQAPVELPSQTLAKQWGIAPTTSKVTVPFAAPSTAAQAPSNPIGEITGVNPSTTPVAPKKGFKYDPLQLSEFARALANRRAHGRLDTRTEAVLMDAPLQVSPTVRGDLLSQQAYGDAATNTEQFASRAFSTDAALNLAGRLAGNAKANQLRTQGGIANANAIRQQEAQALQMDQQSANMRADISNRNRASVANKIQSERIAKNTRDAAMFKSLDRFWAEQNRQGYQDRMYMQPYQDRQNQLNAQMAPFEDGEFAGKNYTTLSTDLVSQMNDINTKLQTTTDPLQRTELTNQLNKLRGTANRLSEANALRLSNPKLYSEKYGLNFVNLPSINRLPTQQVVSQKSGGRLTMAEKMTLDKEKQKDKMIFDWYKEYNSFIKEQIKADAKSNAQSQKIAAKFAENALKTK